MSASAPLGRPKRNTGSDEAVCTSAISVGEEVREVMSHAEATSFIHMQTFEAIQTSQSIRKVGRRSGAQVDFLSTCGSSGAGRFSLMDAGWPSVERLSPAYNRGSRTQPTFDAPPRPDVPRVAVSPPDPDGALLVDQLGDRPGDLGPRVAACVHVHPLGGGARGDASLRVAGNPPRMA